MKVKLSRNAGYALLVVMLLVAVSLLAFSSVTRWTSSTTMVNDRNNAYNQAVAAAEAGTERALSYMARDFFRQSFDPANARLYGSLVPTNSWAQDYEYSDGAGAVNRIWVDSSPKMVMTNLDSQFSGLYGLVYTCTVRANARPTATFPEMAGAVRQNLQLASIPVFQFAIFYTLDLEINPGPVMKITGKVHSNSDIYTSPGSSLEYMDAVTAVGKIYTSRMTNDPSATSGIKPIFDVPEVGGVSSLTLPIGTNNSPADVHKILEPPPVGESPLSDMGSQRYYNQTDLIITTTDTGVSLKAGLWDGFANIKSDLPGTNGGFSFIKTDATFLDTRENKSTITTEIDVGALNAWITNTATTGGGALNSAAKGVMGHQLNSIYVDDQRTNASKLTVVRVTNGKTLPADGLTVATKLPLYVKGQYNAPITTPGSTNTSSTMPASLVADAITVLSQNWVDTNSAKSLSSRPAADTTVNAAFLGGIVQTTNSAGVGHYSGGVENFPRFLEDWNSKTLTYNGSMVVMFPSQTATNFWVSPGKYYNAPNRKWAFDSNFLDYRKLPPVTPQVRKVIRGQWSVIAANAVN